MRVDGFGRVDRTRELRFTFDGRDYIGHPGDTLASALMANEVRLMGRSFKYHRPRGPLTAGPEEPNALMEVGRGAERTPNTRATVQELYEGLEARSKNRVGPLDLDLLAVNDLLSPLLPAGFYYKMFLWPPAFWEKVYEPLIRRAAGLGRLSGEAAEDRDEKAWAHADLLVIGAGPAGIMAAKTAAAAGLRVILADEGAEPGGRCLSESEEIGGTPAADWAAGEIAALREAGVRVMTRTTVTGAYDGGTWGAVERVGLHLPPAPDLPRECFWRIVAPRAVLATGALERMVAFPSNDRPGILTAGAVRAYLHRHGVVPGERVAVFATGDDAHRTATDLMAAGVEVVAVIDPREGAERRGDYRLIRGTVSETWGRLGLRRIAVRTNGGEIKLDADTLAVSGGWNPNIGLACHHGARPAWDDGRAMFLPPGHDARGAVPGLAAAGAAAGETSTAACLASGCAAGRAAAEALGRTPAEVDLPDAADVAGGSEPLWTVRAPGRAWLDMANDVTTKDVALAAREGFVSVEHMKRYTTQGMAPDQGRTSNVAAIAVLADATGRGIAETGTTTFRPPVQPVAISALGAGGRGEGFAPVRHAPSHDAARARFAPMVAAGLWQRASYFPAPGETTWREACDREVGHVRGAVGVSDVSTLGKIEVQGPDAGAFLDFVYANTMSTLAPGRVRYGIMLREDGHVMDDGTVACLAPGRYLVTTTTGAAAQVAAHLEFAAQALRPDLSVGLLPVTDHWAQMAVAGPRAAELLAGYLGEDPGLGFMHCRELSLGQARARLFRISFSGEAGFELAVPSRFGAGLWRDLVARAETLGGGAYGLEALNVLRIEKGFLTHAEMDGRVTAGDLGLGRMLSSRKDFVGRAAASRPGLTDPARPALVGLRPTDPQAEITAGAQLFDVGAEPERANILGHVTSACHSPTLGGSLALGLLRGGPARHGERVQAMDFVRERYVTCTVEAPCFFDPDGGRMRG